MVILLLSAHIFWTVLLIVYIYFNTHKFESKTDVSVKLMVFPLCIYRRVTLT